MDLFGSGPYIIIYHMLPSIVAALVYLLLAQLFMFVFRVKKPAIKFLMYFLVLFKSLSILITGARYSYFTPTKPVGFGFTNYDPLDLLSFGNKTIFMDVSKSLKTLSSPLIEIVIIAVLITTMILLLIRWLATAWFFNKLVRDGEPVDKKIFKIAEKLSLMFDIKMPEVVLIDQNLGPLIIGIKKPTIVVPKKLTSSLSYKELEVVIGHELAHIKRKDNFFQWITLFMKDLLFYNPFAILVYKYLQLNKEIATDNLFSNALPERRSSIDITLDKVLKILSDSNDISQKKHLPIAKAHFVGNSFNEKRVYFLKNSNINKPIITFKEKSLGLVCILLFLWTNAWIAIKLGNKSLLFLS